MDARDGQGDAGAESVLLRQLADNIQEVFWLVEWTVPARILFASRGYENVWGRPVESLYKDARSWLRTVHPDDRRAVIRLLARFLKEGTNTSGQYRIRRPDGTERWIRHQCFHVLDWAGPVPRAVGLALDVTEEVCAEMEQKEVASKAQQAQKLDSLVVLAGGVAHDFNNMLAAILGNVEVALQSLDDPERVQSSLQDILVSVRRGSDLASQMHAYAGRSLFSSRLLDPAELVRQVCEGLRPTLYNCTLSVEILDDPPAVWGEEAQLKQLIVNLVINAAESMSDHGEVIVRLETRNLKEAEVRSRYLPDQYPEGAYVCLDVLDNGCGVDSAALDRLFDPFYSTKFAGRGLGLAAVLGIVRRHGGLIDVSSVPGTGTHIVVALPAMQHGTPPAVVSDPPGSIDAARKVILFADDDTQVRTAYTQLLKHHGYQVLEAEDGDVALQRFIQSRKDIGCVILDLSMPRMDGWQALQHIRELDEKVPVILATGYSEQILDTSEPRIAVDAFLYKPFQLHTLLETVKGVMSRT